jgi:hypothetical protein
MHVRVSLGRNAISRVITTGYFQRYDTVCSFGLLYRISSEIRPRLPSVRSTAVIARTEDTLISLRATLNAALSGSEDAR